MKYVLGFIFGKTHNFVLLQRKARPDWQKGRYNGIGGKIEEGETPEQAMKREGIEEVGNDLSWEKKATMFVGEHAIYVFKAVVEPKIMKTCVDFSKTTDEPVELDVVKALPAECITNVPMLVEMCACPCFAHAEILLKEISR